MNRTSTNEKLCVLFATQGFIAYYKYLQSNKICMYFRFMRNRLILRNIYRISTPGQRVYTTYNRLHTLQRNGLYVISTPKGFFVSTDLKYLNIGGELLFELEY